MEGRAAFGKNRKLFVIVILCAVGLRNRCNPMAESHDKDWVDGTRVEDLQSHFGWLRSWKHTAAFLIDLGMCCLILSCRLWKVRLIYRLSQWHENW